MKKFFALLVFGLIVLNVSAQQMEGLLFHPAGEPKTLQELAVIMLASETSTVVSATTVPTPITPRDKFIGWLITIILCLAMIVPLSIRVIKNCKEYKKQNKRDRKSEHFDSPGVLKR